MGSFFLLRVCLSASPKRARRLGSKLVAACNIAMTPNENKKGTCLVKTVIFDLDGTLADTSGDLIAAANRCFEDLGASAVLDPARDQGTALRGGRAMLRLGMSRLGRATEEDTIDRLYPVFLDIYAEALDGHTVLYPGAMEAIEKLKKQGYGVGICTNKPERLAHKLLSQLGVRETFASLVGADTLAVRKPDPEPLFEAARRAGGDAGKCILVGDSDTDRNTARAAGVPCILVTFGPAGGDMAALAPDALLARYDDLPDLVGELLP